MDNDRPAPLRATPENGHALLLMEPLPDQRTFSDYKNLVTCLDSVLGVYEGTRLDRGLDKTDYTIKQVYEWLDEFARIELFVYDAEISRYKRLSRENLKEEIMLQIEKQVD